ncbi:MAG: glycosyltransferase [Bdellovibrionales bacterium]|nr:glycosyltransferase [Bdellovibrionales bacterium]
MNQTNRSATVIIPTLNEERSIGALIDEIVATDATLKIIVADDESRDATSAEVEKRAAVFPDLIRFFSREAVELRGITVSVLDALGLVDTEFVVIMDGDLQHPPSAIPEMISKLEQGADLVAGFRLPYEEKQAFHRVLATRISTLLAKAALRARGISVRDPMSGFFAANTKVFQSAASLDRHRFELEGYKVLFDLIRATGTKLKIEEVPYTFRLRLGGKSKLNARHGWLFLKSLFK